MKYLFGILIVLVVALITSGLGQRSATLDEVSTITITSGVRPLSQILWEEEGNMWLYYGIVKLWIHAFGNAIVTVRMLSVIFALMGLPVFYMFVHEFWSRRVALGATLLLSCNLYFVFYAREARGYSLAFFLTLLATYLGIQVRKSPSRYSVVFLYGLSIVFALYTSLLTGLVFAVQFAFLALGDFRKFRTPLALLSGAIAIALVPWMLSPAMRGHQVDWLQPPKWVYLPMGLTTLGGDSVGIFLIYSLCIALFLWAIRRSLLSSPKQVLPVYWLGAWTLFPIISTFFFSRWIKPIYEPESFVTSAAPFVLLVALALDHLWSKRPRVYWALITACALLSIARVGIWTFQVDQPSFVFENRSSRDWEKLEELVESQTQQGDGIIFYAYYDRFPIEYYYRQRAPRSFPDILEIASGTYAIGGGSMLPAPNLELLHDLQYQYKRIWLVLSYNDVDWLQHRTQWHAVERELLDHFQLNSATRYGQIEVKLFSHS